MPQRTWIVATTALIAVLVAVVSSGFRTARAPSSTAVPRTWLLTDSFADGTPDFLRLHHPADRAVFRGWFTYLAEAMYFREASRVPPEINDCAALIRFAYREALSRHDAQWASRLKLEQPPPLGDLDAYQYPFTPLKAALFRTGPGPTGEAFAQFADAGSLLRYNTHSIGPDLDLAEPGDLLFYHQPEQKFPFHVMIYLGPSPMTGEAGPFAAYHTGPEAGHPGEIRRPSIEDLRRHRKPQWRPARANPHFLGVRRWNILRD